MKNHSSPSIRRLMVCGCAEADYCFMVIKKINKYAVIKLAHFFFFFFNNPSTQNQHNIPLEHITVLLYNFGFVRLRVALGITLKLDINRANYRPA